MLCVLYIYIYTIQAPSVSFSRRGVYRREGGEKGIAGAPAVWALHRRFLHSHHAGWMDAEREREILWGRRWAFESESIARERGREIFRWPRRDKGLSRWG